MQGRWTLKEASVTKRNGANTISIPVDSVKGNPYYFLFDKLEFKADTLGFPNLNIQGNYLLKGNKIQISFTAAPYALEYKRTGNELRLNQQFTLMGDDYTHRVLIVYKKEGDGTNK
ncbi:hypothetical protein FACS1894181_17120 [Bacteroidia bacterium]|nr:hypothetical protein FACS1894181_17120 [Bacteroidia bacterium]